MDNFVGLMNKYDPFEMFFKITFHISDRNGAMMNDWKKRNCFCDQQCIVYDDCCVDSSYRRDPNVNYKTSENFQCVKLRQFGSLYMKTQCPSNWKDETVRESQRDKNLNYLVN